MAGSEVKTDKTHKKDKKQKDHKEKKSKKRSRSAERCRTSTPTISPVAEPPAKRPRVRDASPPPWAPATLAGSSLDHITTTDQNMFPPPLDVVLDAARISPESAAKFKYSASLAASLEKLAGERISSEPWVSGTAWGLAFLLQNYQVGQAIATCDPWLFFQSTGGNMLHSLVNDPAGIARFFAKYPQATQCIPHWNNGSSVQTKLAISAIAQALTKAGDMLTAKALMQALKEPKDMPALVSNLQHLSMCKHAHDKRGGRFEEIAKRLRDVPSDAAFSTIRKITRKWPCTPAITNTADAPPGKAAMAPGKPLPPPAPKAAMALGKQLPPPAPAQPGPPAPAVGPSAQQQLTPTDEPQQPTFQFSQPQRAPAQRGAAHKAYLEFSDDTFADLREKWPLPLPAEIHQRFLNKESSPQSPAGTEIFRFSAPAGSADREARWHLWLALAETGLFVDALVHATPCKQYSNCQAGLGAKGQMVVQTEQGTVLWMMRTNRLYSPNARPGLQQRLAMRFSPWSPITDGGQPLHGRWPSAAAATTPQRTLEPPNFSFAFQ